MGETAGFGLWGRGWVCRLCIALLLTLGGQVMAEPLLGIHVNGIGEVTTTPDIAIATVQVSERNKDANEAKRLADEVTERVLDLADDLDVAERDVTATSVRVHPVYRRHGGGPQVIDAIEATRTITVRLRDLEQIGDFLNGAIERGINGINNIALDTSQRVELERQALDAAIEDALREGEQVAKRFRVRRGAVRNVHVGSHSVQPVAMRNFASAREADSSMPFSPGEMTIRRDVQVTFDIDR